MPQLGTTPPFKMEEGPRTVKVPAQQGWASGMVSGKKPLRELAGFGQRGGSVWTPCICQALADRGFCVSELKMTVFLGAC